MGTQIAVMIMVATTAGQPGPAVPRRRTAIAKANSEAVRSVKKNR